jgi:hypothetical protein
MWCGEEGSCWALSSDGAAYRVVHHIQHTAIVDERAAPAWQWYKLRLATHVVVTGDGSNTKVGWIWLDHLLSQY